MLSAEQARELLHYDELSGTFTWKVSRTPRIKVGDVAGCSSGEGYWAIAIGDERPKAHRLAWLMVHGAWPGGDLDHIDGNRRNNAIANLRPATRSQNLANSKRRSDNTSGFKGVSFHRKTGRWAARIKATRLGLFKTPEEAHAVYVEAAKRVFQEFARAA